MEFITPPTPASYIEGNLTEVPAGFTLTEMKKRDYNYAGIRSTDMRMVSNIPNRMSQRMWTELCRDYFARIGLKALVFENGQHKWTCEGSPEVLRSFLYSKAIEKGATVRRRKGKTNKAYTFRVQLASQKNNAA